MPRTTHNKPTNKIWRTRRNIRVLKNRLCLSANRLLQIINEKESK